MDGLRQCRFGLLEYDQYNADKNYDGQVTISDVLGVLKDIVALPVDMLKMGVYGTDFGRFFEIQCAETGPIGLAFSLVTIYVVIATVSRKIRQASLDRIQRDYVEKRKRLGYDE